MRCVTGLLWDSNAGRAPPNKDGVSYRKQRDSALGIFIRIWKSEPWAGATVTYEDGHHVLRKGTAMLRVRS